MKMRRSMLPPEHINHDPKKSAYNRHIPSG
jgi:hypothetical protein